MSTLHSLRQVLVKFKILFYSKTIHTSIFFNYEKHRSKEKIQHVVNSFSLSVIEKVLKMYYTHMYE